MVKVCAITNVYNETFNLPLWLGHYGREVGRENCIVVDHGSEALPDLGGAGLIRTPRGPLDDGLRARMIGQLVTAMLEHYDVVLYSDADELLVADPASYSGLRDFFARTEARAYTAVGLDVIHNLFAEDPLDVSRPVLEQRRFGVWNGWLCKTLATRDPIRWGGGFHASSAPPSFSDLYLFHLRAVDLGEMVKRAALTRRLESADPEAGEHHRRPLAWFVNNLLGASSWTVQETLDDGPAFAAKLEATVQRGEDGLYGFADPLRPGHLVTFPERFKGAF